MSQPKGTPKEAIQSGWPPDAPYEYVFIATIREITPIKGDRHTWGEIVELRVDAVLRGNLLTTTTDLYNPPVDASGWGPFTSGSQYLIAASPSSQDTPGQIYTSSCAPNEEITAATRLNELISYSESPVLVDTAVPARPFDPSIAGWLLLALAAVLGIMILRGGET